MITIIGTAHVFDLSSILTKIFKEKNPEIICVELDKKRYNGLVSSNYNNKNKEKIPILYKIFAKFQNNLAKNYGIVPGDDMLTAISYAKTNNLPIGLIDMDAKDLYEQAIDKMTFTEKLNISIIAVFIVIFGWLYIKINRAESDFKNLNNDVQGHLQNFESSYPNLKEVLIDERNKNMAKKMINYNKKYKRIIACVGKAHTPGISKLFIKNNIEFSIIDIKQLQSLHN